MLAIETNSVSQMHLPTQQKYRKTAIITIRMLNRSTTTRTPSMIPAISPPPETDRQKIEHHRLKIL